MRTGDGIAGHDTLGIMLQKIIVMTNLDNTVTKSWCAPPERVSHRTRRIEAQQQLIVGAAAQDGMGTRHDIRESKSMCNGFPSGPFGYYGRYLGPNRPHDAAQLVCPSGYIVRGHSRGSPRHACSLVSVDVCLFPLICLVHRSRIIACGQHSSKHRDSALFM